MPDVRKKGKPYIWVTWLTKLMSGEDKCWWRSWYKAHYKYDKVPESADRKAFLEEWTKKHDAMVDARVAVLKEQGHVVKVEDEGEFTFEGRAAIVAGKPDVVGMMPARADVYDQKSGKRRKSDQEQVRIYMLALPQTWLPEGIELRGFVEYQDGLVEVPPLTDVDRARIKNAVERVAGDEAPARVPSANECKYCEIANCPDRITKSTGRTELF